MKYPIKSIGLLLAASWAVSPLHAQQAFDPTTDVANSGDTAWILTSSALVLLMTLPGLALFYGGLVRSKNFLSVLIQCMAVVGICSVLWIVVGYTLAFGGVT
jgi:Amt family ammonium transporter